jgi:hypothetical protein
MEPAVNNYQRKFAEQHGVDTLLATAPLAAVDSGQDNDADPMPAMLAEIAEAERALKRWEKRADQIGYPNLTADDDRKYDAIMRRRVKAMAAIVKRALAANPEGK